MFRRFLCNGHRAITQAHKLQTCGLKSSAALYQLSDFQTKKIINEFDHFFDRNRDGFVCNTDIQNLKMKLTAFATNRKGQVARDLESHGYDDFWKLFKEMADTNKDGKLSKEEWLELWTETDKKVKAKDFNSLPAWQKLMTFTLFPIIDYNGDSIITEDEYKHFWYALCDVSPDDKTLKQIFSILTENGTKELDIRRFQDLYADFYLSDDETTPGRYISGPFEIN